MKMVRAASTLLLAALSSLTLCRAADDPTGSLPGVLDLSKFPFFI